MTSGQTVNAQLLGPVAFAHFEHLVEKYQANRWTGDFTSCCHFICTAYTQLTRREALQDLIAFLNTQSIKLCLRGLRHILLRITRTDANEKHGIEQFEFMAQRLIE